MITTGFVLIGAGVALFLTGGVLNILTGTSRREQAICRALKRTPTTPIARVATPGLVKLQGRVVVSDRGTVVCPTSGRPVVTYRINATERVPHHKSTIQRPLFEDRDRREYWLDDGSGRRAWVTPHDGMVVLPTVEYRNYNYAYHGEIGAGTPTTLRQMAPQLETWVAQRAGHHGSFLVQEQCIAEGDSLLVLGQAHFHAGVLALRNQPPPNRLLMSTLNEQELIELYGARDQVRRVMSPLTLAAMCVGVLMVVLGIVL